MSKGKKSKEYAAHAEGTLQQRGRTMSSYSRLAARYPGQRRRVPSIVQDSHLTTSHAQETGAAGAEEGKAPIVPRRGTVAFRDMCQPKYSMKPDSRYSWE